MGDVRRLATWGAAVLVSALIIGVLWRPMGTAWRCYAAWGAGTRAEATVAHVDPAVGIALTFPDADPCTAPPGSARLEDFEPGDLVEAVRHPDRPGSCELATTVDDARAVLMASASMLVCLLLGIFLMASVIARKLTEKPTLTTRFDPLPAPLACPRCNKGMEEGYLPLLAGVHWRGPDEPVGMPHALRGMPGTVGLRRRPKVHAFRCEPCEVVIFRYGA